MEKLRKVYNYDVLVDENEKVLRITTRTGEYKRLDAYRRMVNCWSKLNNITLNALRAGLKRGTIRLF